MKRVQSAVAMRTVIRPFNESNDIQTKERNLIKESKAWQSIYDRDYKAGQTHGAKKSGSAMLRVGELNEKQIEDDIDREVNQNNAQISAKKKETLSKPALESKEIDSKYLNQKPPVPQAPTPRATKKGPAQVSFNPDIYGAKTSNPYLKKKPEDLASSIHIDESEFFKSLDPKAIDNTKETVLEQNIAQVLNDHWDARKKICEPCSVPKQLVAYAKMPKKTIYGKDYGLPDTKNIEPIFGEANSPQDRYVPPSPPMDTASMYGV